MNKNVTIIGAGISGLTTSYLLKSRGFAVKILEKTNMYGGSIRSERINGHLVEHGPNSTLETTPLINDLLNMLGILDRKIFASQSSNKRYILKNGAIMPLPMGPGGFLTTKLFSGKAKLRLLKEPFIKSKSHPGETIAEFTRRRLGNEFLDYAINPFVAGVFAGNPENLNVKTAFPKLYDLEQNYGSLIGGMFKSRKERKQRNEESKQSAKTISFVNGMQELTDALYSNLKENIEFNCIVNNISADGGNYTVNYSAGGELKSVVSGNLVLSVPAYAAADMISGMRGDLPRTLKDIYYPPVNVIIAAFEKKDVGFNLDGFGFLIPEKENRKFLGSLWSSIIFEHRTDAEHYLLTNFIGGSRSPELTKLGDEESVKAVMDELDSIIGIKNRNGFSRIMRWEKAIPQYGRNHYAVTEKIESFMNEHKGLFFCSNFYKGISVCDCIKSAFATSDKITQTTN
ncbi:MAG: protoporphyrinogen oxidase [Bacteroidetes bacterium]|nr:protoporphyrinogen oxidase [Bacteroidota bacterium]